MNGKRLPDRENSIHIALALGNDEIFNYSPAFNNNIPGELGQLFRKAEIEFNKEIIHRGIKMDSQDAEELAITVYERFGVRIKSTDFPSITK